MKIDTVYRPRQIPNTKRNSMYVVELVAGSVRGLLALAKAQHAILAGAVFWCDGFWRLRVQLPGRGFGQ